MDCASLNGNDGGSYIYTGPEQITTYKLYCANDILGWDVQNPSIGVYEPSFQACLELCATTEQYDCGGVSFHLTGQYTDNCYFKVAGVMTVSSASILDSDAGVDSAIIISKNNVVTSTTPTTSTLPTTSAPLTITTTPTTTSPPSPTTSPSSTHSSTSEISSSLGTATVFVTVSPSSTSSSSPANGSGETTSHSSKAWIAAAVVVPVAFLALLVIIFLLLRKRRRQETQYSGPVVDPPTPAMLPPIQDDKIYHNTQGDDIPAVSPVQPPAEQNHIDGAGGWDGAHGHAELGENYIHGGVVWPEELEAARPPQYYPGELPG